MNQNYDCLPISIGDRCINRDWFGMPINEVWTIMGDYLHFINHAYGIRIHLFVLMANHFHLIASAPRNNMSSGLQYFLAQTSRQITKSTGRINHTWRARHFRNLIGNPRYYLCAYKYFYRNPISAGLVERVEHYPYSTLPGLLGMAKLTIPIVEDHTLFDDVEGTLRWLNTDPKKEYEEDVRKALRRREFKLPRSSRDGGIHPLEIDSF